RSANSRPAVIARDRRKPQDPVEFRSRRYSPDGRRLPPIPHGAPEESSSGFLLSYERDAGPRGLTELDRPLARPRTRCPSAGRFVVPYPERGSWLGRPAPLVSKKHLHPRSCATIPRSRRSLCPWNASTGDGRPRVESRSGQRGGCPRWYWACWRWCSGRRSAALELSPPFSSRHRVTLPRRDRKSVV